MDEERPREHIVDRLAPAMFSLALVFVMLLGALIVVRVDIPRVVEIAALERIENTPSIAAAVSTAAMASPVVTWVPTPQEVLWLERASIIGDRLALILLLLWPLFWLEYAVTQRHETASALSKAGRSRLFACLVPPWRLATASSARGGRVWLPRLGWQRPERALVRRLERRCGTPMLVVALLILPILLIELAFQPVVRAHPGLQLLLHVSTGLIWCAFAIEFCVLIGASDRKLDYARRHWIDLAIILLPLVSFLRSFRALRLARLAKVQKLARMGRIYRMRGLLMKAMRALMLLDAISRLLRITPEKRLQKLCRERDELEEDLQGLCQEIEVLQAEVSNSGDDTSITQATAG